MNTTTTILDNTRATGAPQAAGHAKDASESTGSEPQQRFADVLPLVQAAMEQASNNGATEKVPPKAHSAKEQGTGGSSGGSERPGRRRKETSAADAQISAWPFGGMIQPLLQRQVSSGAAGVQNAKIAAGQQTAESKTPKGAMKGAESVATAHGVATAGVAVAKTQQRTSVAEQTTAAASAATAASKGDGSQKQQVVSSTATAGKQTSVAAQQTPQDAAAASAMSTSPNAAGDKRAGRFERTQAAAVSGADVPVSGGNAKPDATAAVKAKAAGQAAVPQEKAGETSPKTPPASVQQMDGSQRAAKSGKNAPDSASAVEGHLENAAKPTVAVRRESLKEASTQQGTKEKAVSGAKDAAAVTADSRVAGGGSMSTAPSVATSAQSHTSVDAAAARSPVQSVGEQILDSIRSTGTPGEREVLVKLRPPELGTVVVRFQERGENLTGTLEVSTREAQREIERALPDVLRGLQDAGVQVRRVEVVTSDQSDRNLGGEHLPQDVWQQHQGTGQGREHSPASQTHWSQGTEERNSTRHGSAGEESQTTVAPGRIDVLL
ncbi:MAG: flagellar hook-length control protein FliK [Phycisphaerales bacterium]